MLKIGLDVGSTTLKCVALGSGGEILYRNYQRHLSRISEMTGRMLAEVVQALPQGEEAALCVSGSAGMGLAQQLGLPNTRRGATASSSWGARTPRFCF